MAEGSEGCGGFSREKGVFVQKDHFREIVFLGDSGWRLEALGGKKVNKRGGVCCTA